jgi:GTPase Era involved in 16S rRNA processing
MGAQRKTTRTGSTLAAAIQAAIEDGRVEAQSLRERVDGAVSELLASRDGLVRDAGEDRAVTEFCQFAEGAASELDALFERQQNKLSSYNVSFFGRTGTGKSTLLSTFGGLDGSLVSRGEMDWTTSVQSTSWSGCLLIDTPGIDGAGRTMSREELEARARGAVEVSDLVILCFDDQNQQASEFSKIARWVRDYGKPVIAVLNVRNKKWRNPALVPDKVKRGERSQEVRENADHIDTSLGQIGLHGIPVIALNSRRALDAQAAEPYEGPDAEGRSTRLERYGRENLLAWSNFPLLEELLEAIVRLGAADLRTTSLREGLRKNLEAWDQDLVRMREAAKLSAVASEDAAETAFAVLGYPEGDDRSVVRRRGVDLIEQSESVRGRPYRSGPIGELAIHLRRLLGAHMAPLREGAMIAAEELVWDAFNRGKRVSEKEFAKRVFDQKVTNERAQAVCSEALSFAQSRIQLAARDEQADFTLRADAVSVKGDSGRELRHASTALRVSGLLAGTAGALGTFALANIWNPAGWTAGAAAGVAIIGSAVSILFGWLARRFGRDSEAKRASERRKAVAAARRRVHEAFSDIDEQISLAVQEVAWSSASDSVCELLESATALRRVHHISRDTAQKVRRLAKAIRPSPEPAMVMTEALQDLADRRQSTLPMSSLLRGEDWIADTSDSPAVSRPPVAHSSPGVFELPPNTWSGPGSREFSRWLKRVEAAAAKWPSLDQVASSIASAGADSRPVIALVGDYGSGKSSLIARLLAEDGRECPSSLVVSGAPETSECTAYDWSHFRLLDTPGLKSEHRQHDDIAEQGVAGAALVLIVVHAHGFTGDVAQLRRIVGGAGAVPSKLASSVLLVSRSDVLVADPDDSPREFRRMREHKMAEARATLRKFGMSIDQAQVWSLAADPYGSLRRGPASQDLTIEDTAAWDGIRELITPLIKVPARRLPLAARRGAVDVGLMLLNHRRVELESTMSELENKESSLSDLVSVVDRARSAASILRASLASEARTVCERNANEILGAALEASSTSELKREAKRLSKWWTDEAFQVDAEQFQQSAKKEIDLWLRQYSSLLKREIARPTFVQAFPEVDRFLVDGLRDGNSPKAATGVLNATGKVARVVNRDAVYQIGKAAGYKFKPWQAVKTAGRFNKFGGYLAAAGVVLDAVGWWQDTKSAKSREAARQRAWEFVRASAPAAAHQLAGEDGHAGPVSYLDGGVNELELIGSALESQLAVVRTQYADVHSQHIEVQRLLSRGYALSGREAKTYGE